MRTCLGTLLKSYALLCLHLRRLEGECNLCLLSLISQGIEGFRLNKTHRAHSTSRFSVLWRRALHLLCTGLTAWHTFARLCLSAELFSPESDQRTFPTFVQESRRISDFNSAHAAAATSVVDLQLSVFSLPTFLSGASRGRPHVSAPSVYNGRSAKVFLSASLYKLLRLQAAQS